MNSLAGERQTCETVDLCVGERHGAPDVRERQCLRRLSQLDVPCETSRRSRPDLIRLTETAGWTAAVFLLSRNQAVSRNGSNSREETKGDMRLTGEEGGKQIQACPNGPDDSDQSHGVDGEFEIGMNVPQDLEDESHRCPVLTQCRSLPPSQGEGDFVHFLK